MSENLDMGHPDVGSSVNPCLRRETLRLRSGQAAGTQMRVGDVFLGLAANFCGV
jgi:hypothetical protein